MKFNVPAEYKTSSGIYIIRNSVNDKVYIGSAINFQRRCADHIRMFGNNLHHNLGLSQFVEKYGIECLSFNLLELCNELTRDEIYKRENTLIIQHQATNPELGFNTYYLRLEPPKPRTRGIGTYFCKKKVKKKCPACKKMFTLISANQKYCGPGCNVPDRKHIKQGVKKKSKNILTCIVCNKEFYNSQSSKKKIPKYCSQPCFHTFWKRGNNLGMRSESIKKAA